MSGVKTHLIPPEYARENGMSVTDINPAALDLGFEVKDRHLLHIPAGQVAGNHSHPRMEAFIAIGEGLEMHWKEPDGGQIQKVNMNPDGKFAVCIVSPGVAHAVTNTSSTSGYLMEYANQTQVFEDVTREQVIS